MVHSGNIGSMMVNKFMDFDGCFAFYVVNYVKI